MQMLTARGARGKLEHATAIVLQMLLLQLLLLLLLRHAFLLLLLLWLFLLLERRLVPFERDDRAGPWLDAV